LFVVEERILFHRSGHIGAPRNLDQVVDLNMTAEKMAADRAI